MKNIHILPTEIPGRFSLKSNGEYCLSNYSYTDSPNFKNQNIYITSDEEIKDVKQYKGKWHLEKENILNKFPDYLTDLSECKLVIMTTDDDLINDGVQSIDDDFLEWFVNNTSCEWVVVEKKMLCDNCGEENCDNLRCRGYLDSVWYEIIIPKEESDYNLKDKIEWMSNNSQCKQIESCYNSLSKKCVCPKETQNLDKYIQKISNFVTDNKSKTDNTIDLNAYGLGAIDALKKSRMDEMFEMLKLLVDRLDENDLSDLSATKRAKQLIKDLSL